MARAFGGKYSPGGTPPGPDPDGREGRAWKRGARPEPMRARRNLMYLAPVPLVFTAFAGGAVNLAFDLAAMAALWGAAFLTSEGVKAEAAWAARPVARRPAIPRKLFGTVLTGLGVALASAHPAGSSAAEVVSGGLVAPVLFGITASLLHLLAFGADPWRDRRPEGVDAFQSARVARMVEGAERELAAMEALIAPLRDRRLTARLEQFVATARAMCRRVETDPRDLTSARKFLGIYLEGAREAAAKYAGLARAETDPARLSADRQAYSALLDDLERRFTAQSDRLLGDDRADLSVEIEVLRERLAREGIATENKARQS